MLALRVVVSQRAADHTDLDQQDSTSETNKTMNGKQMSQEDLVQLLKEGKAKGYITGNLPSDPAET